MDRQRASLDLSSDDGIDIADLISSKQQKNTEAEKIKEVAEKSGFISRAPQKTRTRRKRSPFTEQMGIKVRPEIKDIFKVVGEHLDVYDHTVFELAILSLIEKEGLHELLERYKSLTE